MGSVTIGIRHGLPDDLAAREAAPAGRLPPAELIVATPAPELLRTA